MWVFSKNGFVSIVQHFQFPDKLLIRARVRDDLEKFIELLGDGVGDRPEIVELENADYRFRAVADKASVADAVAEQVRSIDYPNFKNAVHGDPARDRAYMNVWSALHRLQDDHVRSASNQIMAIAPYWLDSIGTWVFDDPKVDLEQEPFVSGADEYISHLVREIPDARKGFRLLFSADPFPGWQGKLARQQEEAGGWWYLAEDGRKGWLCPALFRYFDDAPETLYCKAIARKRDGHSEV